MYKLVKDENTQKQIGIVVINGNTVVSIPLDLANTDYQAYLKWVAEGGVPTPADE
jgi:hypothetical protein